MKPFLLLAMSKTTVLAFDIGIKNLAYCILQESSAESSADKSSAGVASPVSVSPLATVSPASASASASVSVSNPVIIPSAESPIEVAPAELSAGRILSVLALENCSLLEPTAGPRSCSKCKIRASYSCGIELTCKRHIITPFTPLTVDEKECSKIPAVGILRTILRSAGLTVPSAAKRETVLAALGTRFALPLTAPKAPRAADQGLEEIHDALRRFVAARWAIFRTCNAILLENQPAFKNPHMKSVQVLLLAVLRERFLQVQEQEQERGIGCGETIPFPSFHLVHAKKKVQGADIVKGDAGYKARKDGSERRLEELFATGAVGGADHLAAWTAAKKKSDMADALCMCADYLAKKKA